MALYIERLVRRGSSTEGMVNGVLGKFAVAKLHFPDEVFLEKLLRLLGS
jgi:hypothetical protein